MRIIWLGLFLFIVANVHSRETSSSLRNCYDTSVGVVTQMGDPFVFKHDSTYYLYGTTDVQSSGIIVYKSDDLIHWGKPAGAREGYALHKEDVWGTRGFWSPEVFFARGKFYMIYTVEEQLAVATSNSPLGPFTQPRQGPMNPDKKEIGHKTFHEDGKTYIYFSRLEGGNVIVGAQMSGDLLSIKEDTLTTLVESTEPWEHTPSNPDANWPVAEAPFVMKHKDTYYLFYTANHFITTDYAVGYATSSHPLGPYSKYKGNPILSATDEMKGTGTTSIVTVPNGELYMFYHAHKDTSNVRPRKVAMDRIEFIPQPDGSPDVVKVHGPTAGKQQVSW
jgi:xylan 1,4-beta-xylosidase